MLARGYFGGTAEGFPAHKPLLMSVNGVVDRVGFEPATSAVQKPTNSLH